MEKVTFGQFLAECRTRKGLTQKELSDKLFVSESTVSKWEGDKRSPDLHIINKLSEILGISEGELVRACVDKNRAKDMSQARKFRIINGTYNSILFIGFSIALFVCFVVNLSVSGTLSWFFIVFSAIMLAAVVLLLPQYIKRNRLLMVSLSWLVGLCVLLGTVCISVRGDWFFVVLFSLIFAYSVIFAPMVVSTYLPNRFKNHKAIISICADALLLIVLLIIINIYDLQNNSMAGDWFFDLALPISMFWFVPIFATVFVLRYSKLGWAFKASVVILIWVLGSNIFIYIFAPLLGISASSGNFWQANLSDWSTDSMINANVYLIVNSILMVASAMLAICGFIAKRARG